jgi:hypothetical protein
MGFGVPVGAVATNAELKLHATRLKVNTKIAE